MDNKGTSENPEGPSPEVAIAVLVLLAITLHTISLVYSVSGLIAASSYPRLKSCCCWTQNARDCCSVDIKTSNIYLALTHLALFTFYFVLAAVGRDAEMAFPMLLCAAFGLLNAFAAFRLSRVYAAFGPPDRIHTHQAYPQAQVMGTPAVQMAPMTTVFVGPEMGPSTSQPALGVPVFAHDYKPPPYPAA